MKNIADWEYTLTQKMIKTAAEFIPPALERPPLPYLAENPALLSLLPEFVRRVFQESPANILSAQFTSLRPEYLFRIFDHDLLQAYRRFARSWNVRNMPIFTFYNPTAADPTITESRLRSALPLLLHATSPDVIEGVPPAVREETVASMEDLIRRMSDFERGVKLGETPFLIAGKPKLNIDMPQKITTYPAVVLDTSPTPMIRPAGNLLRALAHALNPTLTQWAYFGTREPIANPEALDRAAVDALLHILASVELHPYATPFTARDFGKTVADVMQSYRKWPHMQKEMPSLRTFHGSEVYDRPGISLEDINPTRYLQNQPDLITVPPEWAKAVVTTIRERLVDPEFGDPMPESTEFIKNLGALVAKLQQPPQPAEQESTAPSLAGLLNSLAKLYGDPKFGRFFNLALAGPRSRQELKQALRELTTIRRDLARTQEYDTVRRLGEMEKLYSYKK